MADKLVALQIKKRPVRKKRNEDHGGNFNVFACATANEYDLERLRHNLIEQNLYEPIALPQTAANDIDTPSASDKDALHDVLYVTAKYHVSDEPREMFFFREGSVVLWNCSELECSNVLQYLQRFESDSYARHLVQEESESMSYNYDMERAHLRKDTFYLGRNASASTALEKYTFSNAMTTSVKLGIWESALDKYVDSMAYVTEDLKRGRPIRISREEVLRKTGELFALRHLINLSSDLLDTPDFYWDREQLESLYSNTCAYFSVQRRTKVWLTTSQLPSYGQ